MNIQSREYDQLQEQAATLPSALLKGMSERDGPDEGGLTLTREHIITLNKYANYVTSLPAGQDNMVRWLGYTSIAEAELTPEEMLLLFGALRAHARRWGSLSDQSKGLSIELASVANSINAGGKVIIDECRRVRALGPDKKKWEQIMFGAPVALDAQDKRTVSTLVDYMMILKEDVNHYAGRVAAVLKETETFRDEARFKLIPAVRQKAVAIDRTRGSGAVERLRESIADVDKEIEQLSKEYDQYVTAALSGLAAGPIGVAITGGIYGAKAEEVRKERKKCQAQRRTFAEQLRDQLSLEGRMEELGTSMSELDTRLQDVVTAASHLHTAWQTVGSYIEASMEKLGKITTGQELARFIFYFSQFLSQWAYIETTALRLTHIFDVAISAQ
ncbi:alpha-xenorhabdolysin family binary toxin subunit A [Pseudomonas capeferrum]|uniref:alpha-xenorhabdolysin family binary toxin subunit A n=1 Tax=Pseudomonas capeferrum TaxID=1495066 RepID=UPI0015E284BA|nr:alpha-xenorhabdolysin family binary toxin subunit A [Pseudomonas capeferrum]MBA1203413.1 alpha-xenorhabdolysin family binary toxin subunit A [Pseudomonas capeferrum]